MNAEALKVKGKSTAAARTALWGGALHELEGDDGQPMLIVTKAYMTAAFYGPDAVDQVSRFLDRVGAP